MPTDLLLVTIAKALVELAGLFILGQGMLYVLAGRNRDGNFFYQLLQMLTRPVYAVSLRSRRRSSSTGTCRSSPSSCCSGCG